MPPPSPLAIATSSINRLLKEENSYHTELASQQRRCQNLETEAGGDENSEFQLRQEKLAIEETKAVFGPLRERIKGAVLKVEGLLGGAAREGNATEVEAARDALERAKGQGTT